MSFVAPPIPSSHAFRFQIRVYHKIELPLGEAKRNPKTFPRIEAKPNTMLKGMGGLPVTLPWSHFLKQGCCGAAVEAFTRFAQVTCYQRLAKPGLLCFGQWDGEGLVVDVCVDFLRPICGRTLLPLLGCLASRPRICFGNSDLVPWSFEGHLFRSFMKAIRPNLKEIKHMLNTNLNL